MIWNGIRLLGVPALHDAVFLLRLGVVASLACVSSILDYSTPKSFEAADVGQTDAVPLWQGSGRGLLGGVFLFHSFSRCSLKDADIFCLDFVSGIPRTEVCIVQDPHDRKRRCFGILY